MEQSEGDTLHQFVAELNSNLKELSDMALVLGQDCKEQYIKIQSNDSSMYRRAYVRSVCAFIEGIIHRMKRTAAHIGITTGNLLIAEMVMIDGKSFDVDDKGEVVPKPLFIKFLNNVKFGFRVYSKSVCSSLELNVGGVGWQKLRETVKVRDRLTHPKMTTDLEVTDAEVDAAKKAFEWFFISYGLCSLHVQKATRAKTSSSKGEGIATLDAKIHELETELKSKGS